MLKFQNIMDIKRVLLQWFVTAGVPVKNENMSNKQLSEELHKPIITKIF